MNIRTAVDTVPLFTQASSPAKAKILSYGIHKRYEKGEYLFRVRDVVSSIYIVLSGLVVLERTDRDSNRRAIFILEQGSIINEVILEEAISSINCYALTDLEVVCFPRNQFLEIMETDFPFTKAVIDSMSMKIRRLYHQLENTTKMNTLSNQVASRLWKLGRDFGVQKDDCLELPFEMSITFLAGLVGSNRETVSRVVKKMAQENILSIRSGKCKIYDVEKLKDFARK